MRLRLTPHTTDDTGRTVPLWWPLGPHRAALPQDLRGRIYFAAGNQPLRWYLHSAIFLMAAGPFFVSVTLTHDTLWLWALPALPFLAAITFAQQRGIWQRSAHTVRATLLATERCPSCAYDLRGTPSEHSITTCPECRGSWRLPRDAGQHLIGDKPILHRTLRRRLLKLTGLIICFPTIHFAAPDARNRAVEIVYPFFNLRQPSTWSNILPEHRLPLQRAVSEHPLTRRIVLAFGWLLVITVLTFMLVVLTRSAAPTPGLLMLAAATLGFYIVGIADFFAPDPGKCHNRIISILLNYTRCPSCAADLSTTTPDHEGITDCPHCRAAWKLPDPPSPGDQLKDSFLH